MTETEARQKLIEFARSAPGRLPHVVTESIKVLERAIDIADKYEILAAEHGTLLGVEADLRSELRSMTEENTMLNKIIREYREASK